MQILDIKREDDLLYIFTKNIEEDIKIFKKRYKDEDNVIHLWYEMPSIQDYTFLWKKYKCISLWYDYERGFAKDSEESFKKLIIDEQKITEKSI